VPALLIVSRLGIEYDYDYGAGGARGYFRIKDASALLSARELEAYFFPTATTTISTTATVTVTSPTGPTTQPEDTTPRTVYLILTGMFGDPSAGWSGDMPDTLALYGVKAAFALRPEEIVANAAEVRRVFAKGHVPVIDVTGTLSLGGDSLREVEAANEVLYALLKVKSRLLYCGGLSENDKDAVKVLKEAGYLVITPNLSPNLARTREADILSALSGGASHIIALGSGKQESAWLKALAVTVNPRQYLKFSFVNEAMGQYK